MEQNYLGGPFMISVILNLILLVSLLIIKDKNEKLTRTIKLIINGSGLSKQKKLFEKLSWYAKRAALYRIRYRNYECALRDYHSKYRMDELPKEYPNLTFSELCDVLVDKKILSANYYRAELMNPSESLGLLEVLKDVRNENEKPKDTTGS